jgi:type VI secretion system protein ImpC
MVYTSSGPNGDREVELPFRTLVIANFSASEEADYFEDQSPIGINLTNFDQVLARFNCALNLTVADKLSDDSDETISVNIVITCLANFHPNALVDKIPELNALATLRYLLSQQDNARELRNLIATHQDDPIFTAVIDELQLIDDNVTLSAQAINACITDIDEKIAAQVDEILHHKQFRQLESTWRGLHFLLERTPEDEPCSVDILNVSKNALAESFDDVPEVVQSALYLKVYTAEFGQYGGRPYSCIIGDYTFGPSSVDVRLLQQIASVAAVAHCPFIAAAGPAFFDIDDYTDFARLRDLSANFGQPKFAKWNSFKETADARYIALTLPGFLLRDSYNSETHNISRFDYKERFKKRDSGPWGNAAFAFATRLVHSFATTRWCINISGDQNGKVEGLTMRDKQSQATSDQKIPTEILISDRRETELVNWGFLPLTVHKGADSAAFYSANSIQSKQNYPDTPAGKKSAINNFLGSQISYLIIICRLSHYIKMMQREHIGTWKNRSEIHNELNDWLRQYVADMDNPTASVRARRPLRHAQVNVEEVDGKAGWYLAQLAVTPHLKYMGSSFTLKESGKLDKFS